MSKLRIFIADDERPAREFLKNILRDIDDVELVGEAANGADALATIREIAPDLALLDLQMPEISGMDVVRQLKSNELPLIAFVTAFDDHAVQAFELNAVDYLLKPVEKGRLIATIDRAAERLARLDWREIETTRMRNADETYGSSVRSELIERIPIKERDEIRLLPVEDIAAIVADGELLQLFTEQGQKHVINFRLKDLEARLDPGKFVRISRGALVNLSHLDSFAPLPGGTFLVRLLNGQELTSSRQQSKILRERLLKI
jgi:two-component system LytT family response regulator